MNEHLTRHADLIPMKAYDNGITIVGAGSIGSFLTLQLVKMGFTKLLVYDKDEVSIENMSCQFYRRMDIGASKVRALSRIVYDFTNERIATMDYHWEPGNYLSKDIVVSCADSMSVRAALFDAAIDNGTRFFIDTRMGAESALLFVVNLRDEASINNYRLSLYTDADAVQERCSAKATIYTVNMLSGMAAKAIKNITCEQAYPHTTLWSIAANDCEQYTKEYN